MPQKVLADGTVSKVTVVPFYDRTGLIKETIGTLETALSHEILICVIVIIVLVLNLRASIVIASMLPIAVLATFIIMRYTGVAANIVALSGIAIAIGVMVDVGSSSWKVSSLPGDAREQAYTGGKGVCQPYL